jgi:2-polyprenyl-3-methyl-5-hydroxy-6-metoxy-1,4-benzoquinol methylase
MNQEKIFTKYQQRQPDYHWQQISRNIFRFNAYVMARYQQVADLVPKREKLKLLDIGCGDGVLLWLISQASSAQLFGIDTDLSSIKTARRALTDRGVKAVLKQANAYHLPFNPNSFDLVIATEIIEHLAQPDKMLSQIKLVLKPKGQAIITTLIKLHTSLGDKMHVREYSTAELKALLKKYFNSVEIKVSHKAWLKKLYLLTVFCFGRYHFQPFRWLLNFFILLSGYNPFKHLGGRPSQQLAICSNPK